MVMLYPFECNRSPPIPKCFRWHYGLQDALNMFYIMPLTKHSKPMHTYCCISMSLCVHWPRKLKAHYQTMRWHNELQKLEICLRWHSSLNTSKSHALGYFQICKHLCALESDNINPNAIIFFFMIEHLIWMNITFYTYDWTHL
jgi:hypothetical protein